MLGKMKRFNKVLSIMLVFVLIVSLMSAALATDAAEGEVIDLQSATAHFWYTTFFICEYNRVRPLPGVEINTYRNGVRVHANHTNIHADLGWDTTVPGNYSARITLPDGFSGVEDVGVIVRCVITGNIIEEFYGPYTEVSFGTFDGNNPRRFEASWILGRNGDMSPPPNHPFTDVPAGEWFTPGIEFVYNEGIMREITPTAFAPTANFNREMVIATLFRMYHGRTANASDSRQSPFADVPTGEWFAPYVSWGYRTGLVQGTGATTFGTGNPVARQDFAVFMYRYANHIGADTGVPGSFALTFPDAGNVNAWAVEPLRWAVYNGLITGTGQFLEPIGTANRAQAATILMRYVQL